MSTKYTYTESMNYYVAKAKNAKTEKQAWFYYYKSRNLTRFYEMTAEQFEDHKTFMVKFGEAIKRKFGSVATAAKPSKAKTQKPTASAPAPKLAEPTQPAVSKNGRTNNALRVEAVIANLEASIEILRAIK